MAFLETFINVVTIVVLAVPGFVLRKSKLFPDKAASLLAVLLLYIAQPFLMMSSIFNKPFDPAMLARFAWVLGFAVALQLAVYFLQSSASGAIGMKRRSGRRSRPPISATSGLWGSRSWRCSSPATTR